MEAILNRLYGLTGMRLSRVKEHIGGRNTVYICDGNGTKCVLRVSQISDRSYADYAAETEFVHYLARGGASVADVIPSLNGNLVEEIASSHLPIYVSLFDYALGDYISDHGYKYIPGAPLSGYFRETGKVLGRIHALSKAYRPKYRRADYFDRFNMDYIDSLIPDSYRSLKNCISGYLEEFRRMPRGEETYGLVHFDFSDGNYHIDYETGRITAFDFDNACYCWYMYDLANLWLHGEGWLFGKPDNAARKHAMDDYFSEILNGYRSETDLSDDMLSRLPAFIDMVLIEGIVDEFDCCRRKGEEADADDIEESAAILTDRIPNAGLF